MSIAVLALVAVVLLAIGVPVGIALGFGMIATVIGGFNVTSLSFIAQQMYSGFESLPLVAIPCFMLAGSLMETGGLSKRLVNVANKLIGHTTGGLGTATVVACMFFGAISGSGPATTAAMGGILIPYMVKAKYDRTYATGLSAVAGGLGIIVPPSIPLVVYGVATNTSIGDLFLAGLGPALVVGALLIIVNLAISHKQGYHGQGSFSWRELGKALWDAKWALFLPVIILGGIYGGYFTATEAAVVAAVYGIIIGLFVYKELKFPKLWEIFRDNTAFIAGTMFVMAPAKATGQVFAYLNITKIISDFLFSISTNYYVILFLIFIILFIVGMFVQTTPAIVILAPTLLAVVQQVGVDPIHFGIIMTLALAIAFVTPPVALNLFVGSSMTGISIDKITKAALPFLIGLIVAFFVVAFCPPISLAILGRG